MAVTLSIKGVPEDLAEALRARAQRNHRSLQGELMAVIEAAARERPFRARDLVEEIRRLGLRTPDESTRWIREARDRR